MPLFVVTCTDNEGTVEKRLATRPKHVERLQKLDDVRHNFHFLISTWAARVSS